MTTPAVVNGLRWRLARRLRPTWRTWHHWRALLHGRALARRVVARLPEPRDRLDPTCVTVEAIEWTETGVIVARLGEGGGPSRLIVKLPQSAGAAESARRHYEAISALRHDERLGEWRELLPRPVWQGTIGRQACLVETALTGIGAEQVMTRPEHREPALRAARHAIDALHQTTARPMRVDDAALDRWVRQRAKVVGAAVEAGPAMAQLIRRLENGLGGRELPVGWIHGDYWAGNVLLGPDGREATGIVDWAQAAADEPVAIDRMTLVLAERVAASRTELGGVVAALLEGTGWTALERDLLKGDGIDDAGIEPGDRSIVLLSWLRHVAWHLTEGTPPARSRRWREMNIARVLRNTRE